MGMTNHAGRGQFEGIFKRESAQLDDFNMCNASAYNENPNFVGIDASLGNSAYSGTKLQVPALQVLVCIKF
jgi:hypothetical protein